MDQSKIERIRSATFTLARRGYERREVDRFLAGLADWLESGGADEIRSESVKRELERVGEKTASILATAEDTATQMRSEAEDEAEDTIRAAKESSQRTRREADEYATQTRSQADQYSSKMRQEADNYASETRRRADQDAAQLQSQSEETGRKTVEAAQAKARRIVAEGERRRRDIEAVIADLVGNRDAVIDVLERLDGELRSAMEKHRAEPGADRFDTPSELDPAEREDGPGSKRAGEEREVPA